MVAETDDGYEALQLIDQHYPDIVVMDIDIHSLNGIEVVKALRAKSFPGIIIIVSGKNQNFYAVQSVRCGANGFISKRTICRKSSPQFVQRKVAMVTSAGRY